MKKIQSKTTVLREGKEHLLPYDKIVEGDILLLQAGAFIPADLRILESQNLTIDESILTGESSGAEKKEGIVAEAPITKRLNILFMGTHVMSGFCKAVVVKTSENTEFGKLSLELEKKTPMSQFQEGVKHFGYFLMEITAILVLILFAFNVFFERPVLDSLLFALALAVGLTPQLLPAIIGINLSHGARLMGERGVIVKKLTSIENLGSMDLLCTDKTGTLTEGKITLHSFIDLEEKPNEKLLSFAALNAHFQSGYPNPLDSALLKNTKIPTGYKKKGELPFDFMRKILSISVEKDHELLLISKGALQKLFPLLSHIELNGEILPIAPFQKKLEDIYQKQSLEGFRLIGVAYKPLKQNVLEEKDLIFLGFLLFADPIKNGVKKTLDALKEHHISFKIFTGDNRYVATHIAKELGLETIVLGDDPHLYKKAKTGEIFAELDPHQKELLLLRFRKEGHTVGYMGDGVNDVAALHAADVSISVNEAIELVKKASDIIILTKDISILLEGVKEGRKTFANTLKYIFMATSANFGNMFSLCIASLFLPFLPLLPSQILLNNFLSDIPEMAIAQDSVDKELLVKPLKIPIGFIRRFMLLFGSISSIFDLTTFGVLLYFLKASIPEFRTGWFVESVLSATLILLVLRTRKPFYKSKPAVWMTTSVLFVLFLAALFPSLPYASLFAFIPLPLAFYGAILLILLFYVVSTEVAKKFFYRHFS